MTKLTQMIMLSSESEEQLQEWAEKIQKVARENRMDLRVLPAVIRDRENTKEEWRAK